MKIAFLSTMEGVPWGGSEELWARTASSLAQQEVTVTASVLGWDTDHPRVSQLARGGVRIHRRSARLGLLARAISKLPGQTRSPTAETARRWLSEQSPNLAVISNGGALPPIDIAELFSELSLPFVTIGQANFEDWWPDDVTAARYRAALAKAQRCYFVSQANLSLAERQIGASLPNAEVVRNPCNIQHDIAVPWPSLTDYSLEMACVARLHAPSKGQDLFIQALADPRWADRSWRMTLYGDGPHRESLARMAERAGLAQRIVFAGHKSDIAEVWSKHHLLVLSSRYEGLPLALVEAMLCGRPAVVTNVGGNAEAVSEGRTGFIAESPTVDALSEALERTWTALPTLRELGSNAAKEIRKIVPANPASDFAAKLKAIATASLRQD